MNKIVSTALTFKNATIIPIHDDAQRIYQSARDNLGYEGSYNDYVGEYDLPEHVAILQNDIKTGVGGGQVGAAGITRSMMDNYRLAAGQTISGELALDHTHNAVVTKIALEMTPKL